MKVREFRRVPLRRVATITLGKMLKVRPDKGDVSLPYLRAAHVQPSGIDLSDIKEMWFSPEEANYLSLRRGDVVVVEGGAGFGRTAFLASEMPGWGFQNSINRVRPLTGYDGRFIEYSLRSAQFDGQLDLLINKATIPHLTAEKLAMVEVPEAPRREQQAIADFLDRETAEIDAFIADQERLIELLTERRGVSVALAALGIGAQSVPLKRVAAVQTGITLGGPVEADAEEVPYLRVANVQTGFVSTGNVKTIRVPRSTRKKYELQAGDVLVTEGGDRDKLGRGALWDGRIVPCIHQNHVFAIRCHEGLLDPEYLTFVLEAPPARRYFDVTAKQTTNLASTNSTLLKNFSFPLPTVSEQREVVASLRNELSETDAAIADAREAIALSKERRAALISAAVTGKVDVRA